MADFLHFALHPFALDDLRGKAAVGRRAPDQLGDDPAALGLAEKTIVMHTPLLWEGYRGDGSAGTPQAKLRRTGAKRVPADDPLIWFRVPRPANPVSTASLLSDKT